MFSFLYCRTATDRSAVKLERRMDEEGDPLAITAAEAVVGSGVPPWNWRDAAGNGETSKANFLCSVPWKYQFEYSCTETIPHLGLVDDV